MQVGIRADVPAWFEGRVLPVDLAVAAAWGRLLARDGRPVAAIDSLIAATALHHGLGVVTRNVAVFRFAELSVVNPWEATPRPTS